MKSFLSPKQQEHQFLPHTYIKTTTSSAFTTKQVQIGDPTKLWQKLKLATISTSKSYPSLSVSTRKYDMGALIKPKSDINIHISDDYTNIKTKQHHNDQKEDQRLSGSLTASTSSKTYRSIDDLSPEYNGLPFVKKLKILNERQKIEELESIIQTRSRSLDYAHNIHPSTKDIYQPLIRSCSDASTIYKSKTETSSLSEALTSIPLQVPQCLCSPLSPESNETFERRQLKSILRKLNKEKSLSVNKSLLERQTPNNLMDNMENLLTAPTIEGYVARHRKLVKSATVNNTLPSPPISANNLRNGNIFSFSPTESKLPPDKNGSSRKDNNFEQSLVYKQSFPFMCDKTGNSMHGKSKKIYYFVL